MICVTRHRLLSTAAAGLCLVALGQSGRAAGAGFNAIPIATAGRPTFTGTGKTDTITVDRQTTVINWTPVNPKTAFLPQGNTVVYQGIDAVKSGYTVINRILSNGSLAKFDGAVYSRLHSTDAYGTGGNIWFYSPDGIVVGAHAIFNVGSLLLTTGDPILRDGNRIDITSTANSMAPIMIDPGARISALGKGSYVVMVAPRIDQGGSVAVNGTAAYVAAEAVELTLHRNLFDITVITGAYVAPGGDNIVLRHGGSTTGPGGSAADPHRIYMVASSKNAVVRALIAADRIGFDPATQVARDHDEIILSAGRDIVDDQPTPTPSAIGADIVITKGTFTSRLVADAARNLTVRAQADSRLEFDGTANLHANDLAELRVAAGGSALFKQDLRISAQHTDGRAGSALVTVGDGGVLTARQDLTITANSRNVEDGGGESHAGNARLSIAGGSVSVGGTLAILADGTGADGSRIGGAGTGGSASAELDDGRLIVGGTLRLSAKGTGGGGEDQGGLGRGGSAMLAVVGAAGPSAVTVSAQLAKIGAVGKGGESTKGAGGAAIGGKVTLAATAADVSLIEPQHGDGLFMSSAAIGGSGTTGGSGTGGRAIVSLQGGSFASSDMRISAAGFGGAGQNAPFGGQGGAGMGGHVHIAVDGRDASLAPDMIRATAEGRGGAGGQGRADGGMGGIAVGGTSMVDIDGQSFAVGDVLLSANAYGGAGGGGTTGGNGGSATGGRARFSVGQGRFTGTTLRVIADATAGAGNAGTRHGGDGGGACGGSAAFTSVQDGGVVAPGSMRLSAAAIGGAAPGIGATAGAAAGGNVKLTGAARIAEATMVASGIGGSGGKIGGGGNGGKIRLAAEGGQLVTGTTILSANGFGGSGRASGGAASGGRSVVSAELQSALSTGDMRILDEAAGGQGKVAGAGRAGSASIRTVGDTASAAAIDFKNLKVIATAVDMTGAGVTIAAGAGDINVHGTANLNMSGRLTVVSDSHHGFVVDDSLIGHANGIRALTAGSAIAAAPTITGGTVALFSQGGLRTAPGTIVRSRGDLELAARDSADLGQLQAAGAIDVIAGRRIALDGSTSGSLALVAGRFRPNGAAILLTGKVATIGDISLTAPGGVMADSAALTAGGNLTATAEKIEIGAAVSKGALTLAASRGAIVVGHARGGSVTITAGDARGVSARQGALVAGDGMITVNRLDAMNEIIVAGDIVDLGTLTTTASSGGSITLSGRNTLAFDRLSTPGDVNLSTAGEIAAANTLSVAGSISATAAKIDINSKQALRFGSLTATAGDIRLASEQDISSAGAISASGNIKVRGNALALGTVIGTGNASTIRIDATDKLSFIGITANGDAILSTGDSLSATDTLLVGGAISATATAIHIDSDTGLRFDNLRATTGDISLASTGSIAASGDIQSLGGNVDIVGQSGLTLAAVTAAGKLTLGSNGFVQAEDLTAGGDIGVDGGSVHVGIVSGRGSVSGIRPTAKSTLRFAGIKTNGNATLLAGQDLTVVGTVTARGVIDTTASSIDISSDAALHLGDLMATAGNITLQSQREISVAGAMQADAGSVNVTGADGIVLQGVSAAGGIALASDGDITTKNLGTDGDIGIAGRNLALGAISGHGAVSAIKLDASDGLGFSSVTTTGNAVLLTGQALVADRDLSVGGTITAQAASINLDSDAALHFGSLTATAGGIKLTTPQDINVTGTVLAKGGDVEVTGTTAISLGAVTSAGQLALTSEGELRASNLTAAGNIDVTGGTVALGLVKATGASSDVRVEASDALNFERITTGGNATLSTGQDLVANGSLVVGGMIDATAAMIDIRSTSELRFGNLTATSGDVRVAGGSIDLGSAEAAGNLGLTATGAITLTRSISASSILLSSSDIAIGADAAVGNADTGSIAFAATGPGQVTIGGSGQTDGYVLDAAELSRVQARLISVSADDPAADVHIDGVTLQGTAGATARLATFAAPLIQPVFAVSTPGSLTVSGPLLLSNAAAGDMISLSADTALDVVAGSGLVALHDSAGALSGMLQLSSDRITVGSPQLLAALAQNQDPPSADLKTQLATNDGVLVPDGSLQAGGMIMQIGTSLRVQNSGDANMSAGLLVGPGGITLRPLRANSGKIEVVLNGRQLDANGAPVRQFSLFNEGITLSDSSSFNGCADPLCTAPVTREAIDPTPIVTTSSQTASTPALVTVSASDGSGTVEGGVDAAVDTDTAAVASEPQAPSATSEPSPSETSEPQTAAASAETGETVPAPPSNPDSTAQSDTANPSATADAAPNSTSPQSETGAQSVPPAPVSPPDGGIAITTTNPAVTPVASASQTVASTSEPAIATNVKTTGDTAVGGDGAAPAQAGTSGAKKSATAPKALKPWRTIWPATGWGEGGPLIDDPVTGAGNDAPVGSDSSEATDQATP